MLTEKKKSQRGRKWGFLKPGLDLELPQMLQPALLSGDLKTQLSLIVKLQISSVHN